MEYRYINPEYESEKDALDGIAEKALSDAESAGVPTKEILDEETQEYVSARFPKTNDDTLQEDLSQRLVIDPELLDKMHATISEGDRTQNELTGELWNAYEELLQNKSYVEIYKDMSSKTQKLVDNIKILELQKEIAEQFPMAKSGITNAEALTLAKQEAERIQAELHTIHDENISEESLGAIYRKYRDISSKYDALQAVSNPDNPNLN